MWKAVFSGESTFCEHDQGNVAPDRADSVVSINNAGYAHQPKRLPGVRETGLSISTVEGALDYAKTWRTNCLGPLMLSCTLLDRGILRAAPNSVAPVVVNITSGQASVGNATELFHGDRDPRDVLYFHPIYAASKAALNAMTLHLARGLRVSCSFDRFRA